MKREPVKVVLTFEQGVRGLHLSNAMHSQGKSATAVALVGTFVPLPEGNVDIEDPVEWCLVGFGGMRGLGVFQILQDKCRALVSIAETGETCEYAFSTRPMEYDSQVLYESNKS